VQREEKTAESTKTRMGSVTGKKGGVPGIDAYWEERIKITVKADDRKTQGHQRA